MHPHPTHFFSAVHSPIHPNTCSCHLTELCGLKTQWFSLGKTTSRLGTPSLCSVLNAASPSPSTKR